ncbi:hypothetical protein [Mesorhizobium sp. STM 4661]|uniref:hypothetical protein n=1 Tax=Mesorhizobium sp. STM 4661 TaxID=1297570 RepID=UPI0002BE572A|nr:hypothetical protein [Mesorhizobium sp. STM 4661]CCV12264.1 conserved hypothetical protein [Mesorhizobium sp. STM 4661]
MSQRKDLTIDEAIRDPMIRLVMKADRVDPRAFERMLRSLAEEQYPDSKAPPSRFSADAGSGHSRRLSRIAKAFGEAKAFNEACVSW